MEPATYDGFIIHQGTTFSRLLTLKTDAGVVVNLSSYHARMTIRKTWGGAVILALSDAQAGGITLAATSPNITITLTAAQTAALNFQYAVYDLEIESASGTVDRLLEGRIAMHREATT